MKKILSIALSLILILGASSCKDWLDVNTNPNSPNSESATIELRLPWVQYYYAYSWAVASVRSNATTQIITTTNNNLGQFDGNNHISKLANWDPHQDVNLTPYQHWFVGAASNIPDLITKSQENGSTHYEAAALVIKSMGFIMMVDLMGDIPYTQALTADVSPTPDKGEDVYAGCLADLDRAIELFSQPQEQGSTLLSAGDIWCGGDASKWLKLCYGLKARWLGNLSKTEQYNPQAILDAISKSLQSNSDNVKMTHANVDVGSDKGVLLGQTYGNSVIWRNAAYNANERLNRWYVNLLTNFKGSGVEDPRADKLLPHMMTNVKLTDDEWYIADYEWRRDEGVNIQGIDEGWKVSRYEGAAIRDLLTYASADTKLSYSIADIDKYYVSTDAFVAAVEKYYKGAIINVTADAVEVTYRTGMMYCEVADPQYVEDIKYVNYAADNVADAFGLSATDMSCYYSKSDAWTRDMGYVMGTSTFYARPDSDTDILTYSELCFLKAEVLFRQGDKAGAYDAYIAGIKSHFDRMNEKLRYWEGLGCCTTAKGFDVSVSYAPMAQADIDAYMKSAAVKQSSATLTMSDIMMQKLIAMGFDYQNWNDMRRFNYYAGNIADFGVVYTEMSEPVFRTCTNATFSADDQDDMFYVRRWQQCYYETDFNTTETEQFILDNYGQYGIEGQYDYKIYSIPVWWDWTK
ncbi:MAG: SusD/RagB family nutrient-binding outer membrane lipoprotein [Bacteroidales bacterium]|nr:SusD/RagB family nutrient-binding outer membrane lipoprotein [Bacteroidales bacterium]MBQ7017792.1 SusD/RagB family nutrient-binding outer membrane lipoprotein [Bacteroidales bacterium]